MEARKPGRIIALEGVDGSGKTAQTRLLSETLGARGLEVRIYREPGGSGLGEKLRDLCLDRRLTRGDALCEALLFTASRRNLALESLLPAREEGAWVLLDRSYLSTWVYQGLEGGLPLDFLEDLTRRALGEAAPDRILVLDLDPSVARNRRGVRPKGGKDAFESRGEDYLARIGKAFRELAGRFPGRLRLVDASGSLEEVQGRCLTALEDLLPGA